MVEVNTEVLPTSYMVDFETDGQHLRFDKVAGAGGLSLKEGHVRLKVGCCDDIASSRNKFDGPEHSGPISTAVYDIPAQ